jgi:Tfp pilus assembly PilM family ATPase
MNPLSKLINPRFPMAAVGLERGSASAVLLQRQRQEFSLRRAATITLPESLLQPSFEEINIINTGELADALAELVTSAGLQKQRRWSVTLPEAATRAVILTLESAPASRGELDEILRWKTERSFGADFDELRVSRDRLSPDASGRPRYLAVGMRLEVLAEYESVFDALGWHTGLILPRHAGEERWLTRTRDGGRAEMDALLISSHAEGFTAVLMRGAQPLIVRSVMCDEEDRADELYRLLLFYRDRVQATDAALPVPRSIERYLVIGSGFSMDKVGEIINETLGTEARALTAPDVGLRLPADDLSFDAIAAPAGLAALAWS